MSARVLQVIVAEMRKVGAGTHYDPVRTVRDVLTTDGKTIATFDPEQSTQTDVRVKEMIDAMRRTAEKLDFIATNCNTMNVDAVIESLGAARLVLLSVLV